jgi:hypothetical protein
MKWECDKRWLMSQLHVACGGIYIREDLSHGLSKYENCDRMLCNTMSGVSCLACFQLFCVRL